MDHNDNPAGRLQQASTRSTGRLVDEWTFVPIFQHEPSYKVKVSMFVGAEGAHFEATTDRLPKQVFQDTDIEQLRRKTERRLKEHQLVSNGATWEDWLEIHVRSLAKNSKKGVQKFGAGLDINYRTIKRGTHPALPGKVFTVDSNNIAVDFPTVKEAGTLDPQDMDASLHGFRTSDRGPEDQFVYLPDTPEHRRALDHLLDGLLSLGSQLQTFLDSSSVTQNLERLAERVGPLALPLATVLGDVPSADAVFPSPRRAPR